MAGCAVESVEVQRGAGDCYDRGNCREKFNALYADEPARFHAQQVLVIDDTVITGSYNFSRSAQFNAENILFIESAALAERYSVYIDHLIEKYGARRRAGIVG